MDQQPEEPDRDDVLLEKLEALDRRLTRIERKVNGTGGLVIDPYESRR